MLHIFCGEDRFALTDTVLDAICTRARAGEEGQILIVPEQFSHEAERALCRAGGDTISRYAEVLSFSRLASRVFSQFGGVSAEYLDGGGRFLAVYRAVEQVRAQLKCYAAVSTRPEFLQQLGAMLEEFLSGSLTPEQLRTAARAQHGQFAQKLEELALLLESYQSVCAGGAADPVTRLVRLEELLRQEQYAQTRTFYLDGFSDFTAVESQLLETLLRAAQDVTLVLRTDGSERAVFATAANTLHTVKKMAARWNVPITLERTGAASARTEAMRHALQYLLAGAAPEFVGDASCMALHSADTPAQECAWAARRVQELTAQGLRYRDICIAMTDRAVYEAPLRALLARAGIPVFLSGNADILRQPALAALLAALRAAVRLDYDDVMRYAKSALSPLDTDAVDALEHYTSFWEIRGTQWLADFTMHPAGFGAPWDDAARAQLEQLNVWREALTAPLGVLRRVLTDSKTVAEMLTATADFLEQLGLRQTLQEQAGAALQAGRAQQAQQLEQLYEIILAAFEQMYTILGDTVMLPEQYLQTLRMLLAQYQVGAIPACADEVQLGTVEDFRAKRAHVLLVLGAHEGQLPALHPAGGLLTDDERQVLLGLGLPLAPGEYDQLARSMGAAHAALSLPADGLELAWSDTPSFLCEKLVQLFPGLRRTTAEEYPYAPDAAAAAAQTLRTGAPSVSPIVLQAVQELRRHTDYAFTPLSRKSVTGLYGDTLRLSASRIDRFAACRYAYFLSDGLKAAPWKQAKFDAPVFGTFVHYVLECTLRDLRAHGGPAGVGDAELAAVTEHYIEDYVNKFMPDAAARGSRFQYLFARNMEEVRTVVQDVARELRLSQFTARDMELTFREDGGALPPVRISGQNGSCVISGSVDRVDLYEQGGRYSCRVVDYKTGRKDFDYASILCGEGLQMLLYLFALRQSGERYYGKPIDPAGILYVPARADMERVDAGADEAVCEAAHAKARRRKGLVLNDAAILHAMEAQDTPEYLPCKWKKDELTGDIASRAQFAELEAFVQQKVADMTDEMFAGRVTPDPIIRGPQVSSCQYCDFAAACHRDLGMQERRNIRAVRADEFWSELERRNGHG